MPSSWTQPPLSSHPKEASVRLRGPRRGPPAPRQAGLARHADRARRTADLRRRAGSPGGWCKCECLCPDRKAAGKREEQSRASRGQQDSSVPRVPGTPQGTGRAPPSAEGWPPRGFRGQIRTGLGVYPAHVKELRFWSLTGREGPTSHSRWCQLHSELCLGAASSDPTLRGSVCGTRPLITVHAEPPPSRWVPGATQ